MEALPDLVLLDIAANLTGSELAAWCAVSRSWRERLDQDDFWQHRCDKQMAAYLRQTECQVEPIFSNPEEAVDTGLSGICEWRLAYMRQTHLWNNWRQNRFHSVDVPNETNVFLIDLFNGPAVYLFYKNDYLIVVNRNEMQLWRVQHECVQVCAVTLISSESMLDTSGDCVVVKTSNLLQVFEICVEEATFVLKRSVVSSGESFQPVLLFHHILVEMLEGSFTMQVWNIESGEMLKEEKHENTELITIDKCCSETHFALRAKRFRAVQQCEFFVFVYTLPDVVLLFTSKFYDEKIKDTKIVGDHLLVSLSKSIDIYCIKTGQHIKQIDVSCKTLLENFNNDVYFVDRERKIVKLCPGLKEPVVLAQLDSEVLDLNFLNSQYFLAKVSLDLYDPVWLGQLQGSSCGLVVDLECLKDSERILEFQVNDAKTKFVICNFSNEDLVYDAKVGFEVISFW